MYQKKEHLNLFPELNVSCDAQHLLTAWVVAGAGSGLVSMGARCSSKIGGAVLKTTGLAGVLWGANELLDVTLGIDVLGSVVDFASDVWSDVKTKRENSSTHTGPNPDAYNINDHEI